MSGAFRPGMRSAPAVLLAVAALAAGHGRAALAGEEAPAGKPDITVQLVTDENLISISLRSRKEFLDWSKSVVDGIRKRIGTPDIPERLVVQVTLRPDGDPHFVVRGRPPLSKTQKGALLELLRKEEPPGVKFRPVCLRFLVGPPEEDVEKQLAAFPALPDPVRQRRVDFEAADTAGRYKLLRDWARSEVLPTLAACQMQAEEKYPGVRSTGKMLAGIDWSKPIDVSRMIDRNPDFWRGILEMAQGNQLVSSAQVFLLVADGKMDRARRILRNTLPFADERGAASVLLNELSWRTKVFFAGVSGEIERGIALHDRKKWKEALRCYEALLKAYPCSARARYEQFYTRAMMEMEASGKPPAATAEWGECRRRIREADPLYPAKFVLSTGEEAYRAFLQMEAQELFSDPKKWKADLLKYAEIAARLGQHDEAAMLYWRAFSRLRAENSERRDFLNRLLFSLEKLGVTDIKKNFKGDHAKAFAALEKERRTAMEEHPAYGAMKVKRVPEK